MAFAAGASEALVYIHPLIDTVYGPYGPPGEPSENDIERVMLARNGHSLRKVVTVGSVWWFPWTTCKGTP